MADLIQNYADRFHHAKEEDILFVELGKAELHCNPVQQMLHEHDLGRNFVKGIKEGLTENNNIKIIENARDYFKSTRWWKNSNKQRIKNSAKALKRNICLL